jgi:hypothetical protein
MNLQSLIVVVLRLMALDFLTRVAVQFTPQLLRVLPVFENPIDAGRFMALPWLFLIGLIVAAVALWLYALPIARIVTRGVPVELSFGAMSLIDCYSIVFLTVGLSYIASHLPQVLNWAHYFVKTAASGHGNSEQPLNGYDISQAFIPFIIGLLLFINGRNWATSLARRQNAEPAKPIAS